MSQEQLTHISKVHIHKLWGKFDIEWNLHKDVNILSGVNGSGKSTVLRIIADALTMKGVGLSNLEYDICYITFNDGGAKVIVEAKGTEKLLNTLGKSDERYLELKTKLDELQEKYPEQKVFIVSLLKQKTELAVNRVQTFDSPIENHDIYNRLDKTDKSTLNVDLEILQKKYLSFRLDLSKRKDAFLEEKNIDAALMVNEKWNYFLDKVDLLFAETKKKIDRSANEVAFIDEETNSLLSVFKLSSGEKQLLIVLLTALIQDCKQSILLLDEPEISLHLDWQDKLISIIRTLNPNAQLIIATHSPWIIIDGWKDYVTEISEIIK